ncbi:uncharacterized protein LOC123909782 isoform X2 [Trifolium pratense]|uniref:uncharacterized protein LOC123909782 isoform X2 n=1 Tax=Trifolium pratense TaxID=57577 RepID=UPI001E693092|nr:uncharacterized protein LOC123909782 isoform X2 [Trifolium pratense]
MMKTWHGIHSCTRDPNNKTATAKWVAQLILNTMSTSDHMKVNDILTHVRKNFSVNIRFWRAWKAKQMAKEIVEGNAARQYNLLWRYSAELRRVSDNGNTCKITIERPHPTLQPRFGSFYFSFDGCKKGFLKACRPFIGVDGCHLKTRYGGQLLIAVGRDPNDQYFPLAFGVVETETKESWRWFLTLLLEDIGQEKRWVFISDQQKVEHHQHASSFIVNLDKRTCTCNFWELVGIPCRHAISAMGFSNQNPEDFVDHYYSREAYELCYSFSVSAINGQDMWPEAEVEVEDMLPPQYKRGPGRPKKMRRRDAHEDAKPRKQRPAPNRCTKCGNPGHNTRGCKSTEVNSDAQRRQRKPKKNVENASASNGFVNASTTVGTASNAAETASTAVSTARVVKAPIECLLDENDDNVLYGTKKRKEEKVRRTAEEGETPKMMQCEQDK